MMKLLVLVLVGTASAFQAPVTKVESRSRMIDVAIPVIAASVLAVAGPVSAAKRSLRRNVLQNLCGLASGRERLR